MVSAGRAAFRPSLSYDRAGAEEDDEMGTAALLRQMRFQDEESVMEAIAVEREEAITEVTRQLVELRDVFRDFAQLVAEQQEGIDLVARNVEDAHARTKDGYEAVLKAEKHQQQAAPGCAVM
jgi:t-SNARE complex subunit (syntaxin)